MGAPARIASKAVPCYAIVMFKSGQTYRAIFAKGGHATITGECIGVNDRMVALNVEGVQTIVPLPSVLYFELVDEAADEARKKARGDRAVKNMIM